MWTCFRFAVVSVMCAASALVFADAPQASREDAVELMRKVWSRYAERSDFGMRISKRSLVLMLPPDDMGGFRVIRATQEDMWFTWREPSDCRILFQTGMVQGEKFVPRRILGVSRLGDKEGRLLVWNPTSRGTTEEKLSGGGFWESARRQMGSLSGDPVFSQIVMRREGGSYYGESDRGLKVADEESWSGVRILRVEDDRSMGRRTTYWVDPEKSVLVRMRRSAQSGGAPARMAPREVVETIYEYDFGKQITAQDMDIFGGLRSLGQGELAGTVFGPIEDLVGWLQEPERSQITSPGSVAGAEKPPVPSAPASEAVKTEPVNEKQLLKPEQMAAIVLIEGDGGAGTGFLAQIRGVNFVVTNLHVIGGNEAVKVTTVSGVPIKVGGMFGAVGRDVALLRVEGELATPGLPISENPLQTAKLGDKVVVVGNRRGGGVATQVSGVVRGIGPEKIEVDAPFQPGNSGSPIVHVASGEVLGLATYSETRKLDLLDGPASGGSGTGAGSSPGKSDEPKTEQRWFGYRADGVAKWEAIDLAKWRAQAKRIADFQEDSEAIYYAMNGRFKQAQSNPRVRLLIDRLEERYNRMGGSQTATAQEVHEFFRGLRALADTGTKELKTGDYYDFFRTSLYWETSIPEQLRAREELGKNLDRASENVTAFLAKLRR